MSSQSATVIDLNSYRAARSAGPSGAAAGRASLTPADVATIAWVPVWFMPVMFFGMPIADQ